MTPILLLDYAGVAVFAATGALAASRKQLDIIGFLFLATITGIGGGTFRDLILGVPVFWVANPDYCSICAVVAVVVYFTAHRLESRYKLLLWLDAIGLAAFAVMGAAKGWSVDRLGVRRHHHGHADGDVRRHPARHGRRRAVGPAAPGGLRHRGAGGRRRFHFRSISPRVPEPAAATVAFARSAFVRARRRAALRLDLPALPQPPGPAAGGHSVSGLRLVRVRRGPPARPPRAGSGAAAGRSAGCTRPAASEPRRPQVSRSRPARVAVEEARRIEVAGAGRVDQLVDGDRLDGDRLVAADDDRAQLRAGDGGEPAVLADGLERGLEGGRLIERLHLALIGEDDVDGAASA